jgi:hypothetical protein
MLDTQGRAAKHDADPVGFASEQPWPTQVVLNEGDRSVVRLQLTDREFLELLVADHVWASLVRRR